MRRWILLGVLVITASWGGWIALQRHREAVEHRREAAWLVAYERATQAFYGADYPTAEKLFTDLIPEAEKFHAKDHYFAELFSMLGTSYSLDHKPEQAEPALKRALQVYATISPADLLGMERTEDNLAGIYRDREDYASAEQHFSEALSLSEKIPGVAAYEHGDILLNLGFIRMVQGRYAEAEQLLNSSIEALASDPGPWAQRDLANAYYRLAGVYTSEHRYTEAQQQYQKALQAQEKLSGPNSREVARTLRGLAELYQDEEKYGESESLYKQAIGVYEKTVGPEDPELADALEYLGCLYRDQEQETRPGSPAASFYTAQARPLLERALAIREKAFGREHAKTADTLSDLSLLEFFALNPGEAERLAQRALPIQEKAYGSDSLPVSTTLNRLGLAERDLNKFAEAEASIGRALAIREKKLPGDHPWVRIILNNLASVYLAQGEVEKAAPLLKRAQAIR